nr:hypothetical protein [Tanacetum cinerariifolium]
MKDTLSKFMSELEKRHEENSNLIKEIRASTYAAIRNQGASIKTLEIQIEKMSKVLQEREFGSLPSSTKTNLRDHVKSISTIVEADSYPIRHFIILDMPEDIKVPLILERPFLSTAHAKIDVFKRKITLRVRKEKIIFKSVKPTRSLINKVYMLSLRERMDLDLEARLMGETLVLNRSLDPFYEDYIKLNDLNIPLELRRDQVDDLMPTIEEGEVVKKFRARNDIRMVSRVFGYPSDCDHDKKIRIDYAFNLKFSCMTEAKDLATLPLDELIGNRKVYEMVLDNDGVASKTTKEKIKSLALKAKSLRSKLVIDSGVAIDLVMVLIEGHFASECTKPKENKDFVGRAWSESEYGDELQNDATFLMAIDSQELQTKPSNSNNDLDVTDLHKENEGHLPNH